MNIAETIVKDVVKGVEWPFQHIAVIIAALGMALKDAPEIKDVVIGLVKQFGAFTPDVMAAIATDGLNIPRDLEVMGDMKNLFVYFRDTFAPVIEKVWGDVKALESAPAATAEPASQSVAPTPAPAAVQAAPALASE